MLHKYLGKDFKVNTNYRMHKINFITAAKIAAVIKKWRPLRSDLHSVGSHFLMKIYNITY